MCLLNHFILGRLL